MAVPYRTSLFIFRRDLRLDDNRGLLRAVELSERVLPAFIFDPRQQPEQNDYFGSPCFQFLIESLEDLDRQIGSRNAGLYLFRGEPHDVVDRLIREVGVDAVFLNRDYTPFSRQRDGRIQETCGNRGVAFQPCSDLLLHEPGEVLTGTGEPYRVFTPFYKKASSRPVDEPRDLPSVSFYRDAIDFAESAEELYDELLPERSDDLHVHGGRSRCLEILDGLGRLTDYPDRRDQPADDGTTSLSAHHKFGTASIREVHRALRDALGSDAPPLIRQLWWRDFFTQIAWFQPHVFGRAFNRKYDDVEWPGSDERFAAWTEGRTGFPIVDAGMRQLAESGWMHNRVRMIVASFLTKDLHVDWRKGERWFARRLVDYDPSVNNGNWQWAASTGADAQPYFRIFNPWSQQKKHDPDAEYVHRWVPELQDLEADEIHRLADEPELLDRTDGYPEPLVDHKKQSRLARERFEAVS